MLPRADACHRRRDLAAARRDSGTVPSDRNAPSQICLPSVQAPAPERLIKGGLPTEAMVAYVLVAKFAWHLPLYRQAQMLLAQGLDIKRAVLAFWVGYAAAELQPLYVRLRELILSAGKIAVDETVVPVLDPDRGRTKEGYFWANRSRRPGLVWDRPSGGRLHLRSGSRGGPRAEAARSLMPWAWGAERSASRRAA
jgi:transposase